MECAPNTSKRDQWSERFARYDRSELTVREFCRSESVSVPSFYHWKQKLRGGVEKTRWSPTSPPSPTQVTQLVTSAFKPILVTSLTQTSAVTIRLPRGIVVELGDDRATIEQVMRQLLTHAITGGTASC